MGERAKRICDFWLLSKLMLINLALSISTIGHCAEPPRALSTRQVAGTAELSALGFARSLPTRKLTPKSELPDFLEPVALRQLSQDNVELTGLPSFSSLYKGHVAAKTRSDDLVLFTIDPNLQRYVEQIARKSSSPHLAIVAMEPYSGKILAMTERSPLKTDLLRYNQLPAASLFKLVTTAAALEGASVQPNQIINFRGGTYTLNRWNYNPNPRTDNRSLPLNEALGMSCNPVFSRIMLKYLKPFQLRNYAKQFGFNSDIPADFDLPQSPANIPTSDYEIGRTAAGFGDVYLTPIHAAAMMAGIANGGFLPKPLLVEQVENARADLVYDRSAAMVQRMLLPKTADDLMRMMISTTTKGTSKREFYYKGRARLPGIQVAAKTGTLSGSNPKGVNHWFVAAAPAKNPKIVLAVVVVDQRTPSMSASRFGRMILEQYLLRSNKQPYKTL